MIAPPALARLPIRAALWATIIAFLVAAVLGPEVSLTTFFLHRQDRWLLLAGLVVLALARIRLTGRAALPELQWRACLLVALALAVVTLAGHYWVLCGYDLSRDEQMATFDAAVFASGHLVQPLPVLWRDHADALNTLFMVPAAHRGAWISAYLPVNAALRALCDLIATPAIANPLLTALGAVALWGCFRRLWPEDREAGFIAMVLYAGSAQVLMLGMTSYAMPGHLALNLCWLWLFLRRTWAGDAAALVVGFAATGLHQIVLHPLFAAPLLALLLIERRWDRAALYGVGYALIGAFWLGWSMPLWALVQSDPHALPPVGVDVFSRLPAMLNDAWLVSIPWMTLNLLRFIAWQHLLLVPLALLGLRGWRRNPMIAALAAGPLATLILSAVVLPYQGHGFGYRYLHGLIGNGILLAIFGWKSLGDQLPRWRTLLVRTSAAGAIVLVPTQMVMAHRFYAPVARASAQIAQITADYAVIGQKDVRYSRDLVFNPPLLNRRPIRLIREALDPATITAICASHPSVVLIGDAVQHPIATAYGFDQAQADRANRAIAPRLAQAGCIISAS